MVFIIGLLAVNLISVKFSCCEQIGFSFLVGMGLQTIGMALIDMAGVRLTVTGVMMTGIMEIIVLSVPLYRRKREIMARYARPFRFKAAGCNLVWLFFLILIVYFELMNFAKCMYFPTFDRDSLAGFDTIGYVIAREHTLRGMSLFQQDYMPHIHDTGSYIMYAPMLQLSYAFVYILGAGTSKVIPALIYLFFLISFYGSMRRIINRTGAATGTFLMMITPEMIAFSSLSATNVVHAISASSGIIYLSLWFKYREKKDLYLGSLLLALNVWIRTDGIVFIVAVWAIIATDVIKRRSWTGVWPVMLAVAPALLWAFFAKISNFYTESILIPHPYWDAGKAGVIATFIRSHLMNTQYYGWTFIVFLFSFLLNIPSLIKRKESGMILIMMLVSLALYMFVLYQIDYKWDSVQQVMAYSAKRFLFCFIPMAWFFSMANPCMERVLKK